MPKGYAVQPSFDTKLSSWNKFDSSSLAKRWALRGPSSRASSDIYVQGVSGH
ncbi:hypothetical protein CC1G_14693 [Coprinopsis cinerea okayama7|uniref:Uncharacterized protein n=1 Tax=Coprinopsis cinerea (strain Okayama-7 / 130 / ATCC MYA-4618 / FGSC 9003) TaxID=240176 RepID=D6RMK7_COPC7|nr:hypothetical protein CC1G_14693 [Coprinopsis cinerea okayama7\|eukprot:XP_002911264.1 hypothetical protein CC1G_14693 [Coprinopsis cinerea okayama7\